MLSEPTASTAASTAAPAAVPAVIREPPTRRFGSVASAYLDLTKPRIVMLLLVTALPTMMVVAGGWPSTSTVAVVLLAGTGAAGAANTINCYLDRDIDVLMRRTQARPLAVGLVSPRAALTFGLVLAVVSVTAMLLLTNPLAAALTAATIANYDLVYTLWLKRTTHWNTLWGSTCGAAPVLIGCAAVTGRITAEAWVMFAIVFFWQPAHFYALALHCRDDYAAAAIPMLPVLANPRRVAAHIVGYAWLTVAASLVLIGYGGTPLYSTVAMLAAVPLLAQAYRLRASIVAGRPGRPMRLFHGTIGYLTVLFAAIAIDAMIG